MGHAGETVHQAGGEAGLKLRIEVWGRERDLGAILREEKTTDTLEC